MRRLVLLGASNPEVMRLIDDLRAQGRFDLLGFIDNDPAKAGGEFCTLEVLGGFDVLPPLLADELWAVNLVTRTTGLRHVLTAELLRLGCRLANLVHSGVSLDYVTFGTGNYIQAAVTVQAGTVIGNNVSITSGSVVSHECTLGDSVFLAPSVSLAGKVQVGTGAYLGTNATVLPRLRIGAWSTVGAGAVVISDVPDGATVVGNPATVVSERSGPWPPGLDLR